MYCILLNKIGIISKSSSFDNPAFISKTKIKSFSRKYINKVFGFYLFLIIDTISIL